MTYLEISLAVISALSGAVAGYVSLKFDPLIEQVKDLKAWNLALERRLTELEKVSITRSEMENIRRDLQLGMEKLGDRLTIAIKELGNRVDHALERVNKVEAFHG